MKTAIRIESASFVLMFQFLIGRMKTEIRNLILDYIHKFQFLIGRMKTLHKQRGIKLKEKVSIPHR